VRLKLEDLRKRRADRPTGYYEDVVSRGVVDGDTLTLPDDVYRALCLRYRVSLPPHGPRLDQLMTDYDESLAAYRERGERAVTATACMMRLKTCRACDLWTEPGEDGYGQCGDVRRSCARLRLWSERTRCLRGKWL